MGDFKKKYRLPAGVPTTRDRDVKKWKDGIVWCKGKINYYEKQIEQYKDAVKSAEEEVEILKGNIRSYREKIKKAGE